jgi:predicted dehydrogenase
MKFPSGALASCVTTYGFSMPGYYRVYGAKGWLEVKSFGYSGLHLRASYKNDAAPSDAPAITLDEPNKEQDPKQFERQVEHFSDCILHDRVPGTPGEEGLRDMLHMLAIYKAAGIVTL